MVITPSWVGTGRVAHYYWTTRTKNGNWMSYYWNWKKIMNWKNLKMKTMQMKGMTKTKRTKKTMKRTKTNYYWKN